MTFGIKTTNKYEKDLKLAMRRGLPVEELLDVVRRIANNEVLPPSLHDHKLTGEYRGHRECHINPDWLLIYRKDTVLRLVTLVRTGTHSDLFKK